MAAVRSLRAAARLVSGGFPRDHQLLTRTGFKYVNAVSMDDELATYNPSTKRIEYCKPNAIEQAPQGKHRMVDVQQHIEARHWAVGSSPYGSRAHTKGDTSNHVSLSVSADHDLYCYQCRTNGMKYWTTSKQSSSDEPHPVFQTFKASELLSADSHDAVRMLAHASDGFAGAEDSAAAFGGFFARLGLRTVTQINAFMELYGYWCGQGSLDLDNAAITFPNLIQRDCDYLKCVLRAAGVRNGIECFKRTHNAVHFVMAVRVPEWFTYFRDRVCAGVRTDITAKELRLMVEVNKRMDEWVWLLNCRQLRILVSGVHAAIGRLSLPHMYTSSVALRDDLVRTCLHAGYAVHFQYIWGDKKQNKPRWMFKYYAPSQPAVQCSRDMSYRVYQGTLWRINVPHHYVLVRRAYTDDQGIITKASKPVIIGDCPTG